VIFPLEGSDAAHAITHPSPKSVQNLINKEDSPVSPGDLSPVTKCKSPTLEPGFVVFLNLRITTRVKSFGVEKAVRGASSAEF
jgi:hypothetical protein